MNEPLPPLGADMRTVAWWLVIGVTVGGVVGGLVGGVDFHVLEPRWLAIVGFVALPGLAALIIASAVERCARLEPWLCSPWYALLLVPALPGLLAAPLCVVSGALTVALGRVAAFRRLPGRRLPRVLAFGLVAVLIAVGTADITRDASELL